ncbi:hypothetical protein D3C85_1639550 [compost metagenome]
MGRNSVSPSTMPRITAFRASAISMRIQERVRRGPVRAVTREPSALLLENRVYGRLILTLMPSGRTVIVPGSAGAPASRNCSGLKVYSG